MTAQDHEYDDPELSAVDFLLCVMRDQSLPLPVRVDAADKLLPLYQKPQPIQTIKITGGLQDLTHAELVTLEARSSGNDFAWDLKPRVH